MRSKEELVKALVNYKQSHRKAAEKRGNLHEFLMCTTLTEARRLAYGSKDKSYAGYRGWPELEALKVAGRIK